MALGMLIAAALIIPVVLLSLFYIRSMNFAVSRIVDQDIELMHIADEVDLELARARRDEKNFQLYRDSVYLRKSHAALDHIGQLCADGRELDASLGRHFDAIVSLTGIYRALADSLVSLPLPEAPARVVFPSLSRLREHHRGLLEAAGAASNAAERDSLLLAAAQLAGEISWPGLGGRTINDSIASLQSAVSARTDSVGDQARTRVFDNRKRARTLAAWGQRNIATVLLIVLVVLVWLVVTLPNRAVLPVKRIVNALRRVEEGDLDVRIKVRSRDELGELARQLNRSFARLSEFDERKVNRILHLERRFRLLINDISEGVLVVDRVPNIVLANAPMEGLLGCTTKEAVGRRFDGFVRLTFLKEPLERVLAGSTSQQTCDVVPELPGSTVCIEALRDRSGNVTGALLVISRPPGVDESAAAGTDATGNGRPG